MVSALDESEVGTMRGIYRSLERRRSGQPGFTLVELLVVVILSLAFLRQLVCQYI